MKIGDMNERAQISNRMEANNLSGTQLAFIGAGVMAEAMVAGLLRGKIVHANQVVVSHPRADRRG